MEFFIILSELLRSYAFSVKYNDLKTGQMTKKKKTVKLQ